MNRGSNPRNPFDTSNSQNDEDGYVEEEDTFKNSLNQFTRRFKTLSEKNENEKERVRDTLDRKINLKYIKNNFNVTSVNIINDIIKLFQRRCDLDCLDDKNPTFSKITFYSHEILKILTRDGRMMFVGILMIILSIIFYFIGASL